MRSVSFTTRLPSDERSSLDAGPDTAASEKVLDHFTNAQDTRSKPIRSDHRSRCYTDRVIVQGMIEGLDLWPLVHEASEQTNGPNDRFSEGKAAKRRQTA